MWNSTASRLIVQNLSSPPPTNPQHPQSQPQQMNRPMSSSSTTPATATNRPVSSWGSSAPTPKPPAISYLNAKQAADIDVALMSPEYGYSIDQLMELAGLSCAQAIHHYYPPNPQARTNVLILCGPGNNGGDGLVCARHLTLFGYSCRVVYPIEPKQELYKRLLQTLRTFHVPILDRAFPDFDQYDLIVDAIFGFSFNPQNGIREPYAEIIKSMVAYQSKIPIVAIDIPSSWDVSLGDTLKLGFQPQCLISLTAPKECARLFRGKYHALGGRFMNRSLLTSHNLILPDYPGSSQFIDISSLAGARSFSTSTASSTSTSNTPSPSSNVPRVILFSPQLEVAIRASLQTLLKSYPPSKLAAGDQLPYWFSKLLRTSLNGHGFTNEQFAILKVNIEAYAKTVIDAQIPRPLEFQPARTNTRQRMIILIAFPGAGKSFFSERLIADHNQQQQGQNQPQQQQLPTSTAKSSAPSESMMDVSPLENPTTAATNASPSSSLSPIIATPTSPSSPTWIRINQDTLGSRKRCEYYADRALRDGHSLIIDRTNIDISQRATWIRLAQKYELAHIEAIYLQVPVEICKQRVLNRTDHETLPPTTASCDIVDRFLSNFVPPLMEEGFSAIRILPYSNEPNENEKQLKELIRHCQL